MALAVEQRDVFGLARRLRVGQRVEAPGAHLGEEIAWPGSSDQASRLRSPRSMTNDFCDSSRKISSARRSSRGSTGFACSCAALTDARSRRVDADEGVSNASRASRCRRRSAPGRVRWPAPDGSSPSRTLAPGRQTMPPSGLATGNSWRTLLPTWPSTRRDCWQHSAMGQPWPIGRSTAARPPDEGLFCSSAPLRVSPHRSRHLATREGNRPVAPRSQRRPGRPSVGDRLQGRTERQGRETGLRPALLRHADGQGPSRSNQRQTRQGHGDRRVHGRIAC